MYCSNCGKYNVDGVKECKYCGCGVLTKKPTKLPEEEKFVPFNYSNKKTTKSKTYYYLGSSKTGLGFLAGIFLGFMGLVIGLLYYPYESIERDTFVSGWLVAFWISVIIAVIAFAIGLITILSIY